MAIKKICVSCGASNKESAKYCEFCSSKELVEREYEEKQVDTILLHEEGNEYLKKATERMKVGWHWHDLLTRWIMGVWSFAYIVRACLCFFGLYFPGEGLVDPKLTDLLCKIDPYFRVFLIGCGIYMLILGVLYWLARSRMCDMMKSGWIMFMTILGMDSALCLLSFALYGGAIADLVLSMWFPVVNIIYYLKRKKYFE